MFDRDKVLLGITPTGWTNDDMPGLGEYIPFEQCVSEMALAGFEGCSVGDTVDTGHRVNYCETAAVKAVHPLLCVSSWAHYVAISLLFVQSWVYSRIVGSHSGTVEQQGAQLASRCP
jgi:hypothetical protein